MQPRALSFIFELKLSDMKRTDILIYTLAALFIFSCASKKEEAHGHPHEGSEQQGDWKEMDEFHMIMAETFHPYKDSANLEPVKTRAVELMAAAEQWASAGLPARVDNEEVKEKLKRLRSEAESLAESVRTADENVIAEQLTRLHDTFHEIQETWYGGHH